MTTSDVKSALPIGRAAWIAFGFCFLLFVVAGWPGWMSVDTLAMQARAANGPIYDWHSPILLWVWKYLGAGQFGPLVPFLGQAVLFWTGLLLLVGRLQRLGWRLAWLLFPGVLFLDATWTVAWVWKDSLEVSLLLSLVGLAASTDVLRKQRRVWLLIAVLAATLVATRWYLAPLGLFALLALFCIALPIQRKTIWVTLATFAIATAGLYGFERLVIKPEKTYSTGQLMMLDIARVECSIGNPEIRRAGDYESTLFPAEFMRHVPGDDICSRFSTYEHDPIFMWRGDEVVEASYVLPNSDASMSRLTSSWLNVAREHPGLLAEARIKQMMVFLNSETELWWSPSRQLPTNSLLYLPGSMGDGDTIGFGSLSRAPLVVGAVISYLGSLVLLDFGANLFGLFSLIMIPSLTAALGWRRGISWRLHYLPALGFPFIFLVFVAMISPGMDVRYLVPAAIWSLAVSILALADRNPPVLSLETDD